MMPPGPFPSELTLRWENGRRAPHHGGYPMCGITGFLERPPRHRAEEAADLVGRMTATLSHRGPDDRGAWADPPNGVALGHRRLAVIDLSEAGQQPMVSHGGRYVLTYNGEIYNMADMRKQLSAEGHRFRGHSDTEVLLTGIESWGLERALARLNGMFAFAVWDRHQRVLQLARDRLGEKPLFYSWAGQTFLFGSELKALRAHPDFERDIDLGVLALYFRHNCVPAPHSIHSGCFKLPPGSVLTVAAEATSDRPVPTSYWSAREAAEAGVATPIDGSPDETTDWLEDLLADAVRLRMHADVPLGAFLSGGVDSATVVAMMQSQSDRRVKTFTIGFADANYDESAFAAGVARHLGTDHTELMVTADDAIGVIPRLPTMYDEPFSDSSQIPTFLVSELSRRHVTVSLSGDGGDELFGGYNRYSWGPALWRRIRATPQPARAFAADVMSKPSPQTWDAVFRLAGPALPDRLRVRNPGTKLHKLAGVLQSTDLEDMYVRLASHWNDPTVLVTGAKEATSSVNDATQWPALTDPVERMMYLDLVTYLPDDILVKIDRASMAVSLEARVPMLDHRLVEFAWRVPLSMKIRDGRGKWILRQLLYRHVPEELIDRPKAGFGLPIGDWLRGPLRDWAETLVSEDRLRRDGYLDPGVVRDVWETHLTRRRNLQDQVWDVLMFQSWLGEQAGPAVGVGTADPRTGVAIAPPA